MRGLGLASIVLAACAATAQATWSIVLFDSRTGEIGIASATCLANFDLQANSPVVVVGRGAAAAQSSVDVTGQNRMLIRDRLRAGVEPANILAELAATDLSHESRQYGIVGAPGIGVSFTGLEDGPWAGGVAGSFTYTHAGQTGVITYAIQGNVLTGEPVVSAALQAVIETNSDLPGRLMAGMEAARSLGGDGRCSCTSGGATACGSPPASFARTANCGYFIISRAGDADASVLSLATTCNTPPAAEDLDGDGMKELLVPDSSSANGAAFRVFANTTPPGSAMPVLGASTSYPCVVNPTCITTGDFTRDGRPDVVVGGGSTATGAAGALTSYRTRPDGRLEASQEIATPRRVQSVVVADLDGVNGPDLAYATSTQVFVAMNTGTGVFSAPVAVGNPVTPSGLSVADLNGDGAADILIGAGFTSVRYYTGRGDGTFNALTSIPVGVTTRGAVVGDFNGDGRKDIAVVLNSSVNSVVVLTNSPTGFSSTQTLALNSIGGSLCLADVNGDGKQDLACLDSVYRLVTMTSSPTGIFSVAQRLTAGSAAGALILSDLNGDGLPEAVASMGSTMVMGNVRGTFVNPTGYAAGKYFIDLNIANQSATAIDPVIQMRTAFDALRLGLTGVPDAVCSRVAFANGLTNLTIGKRTAMVVELRDHRGQPVVVPASAIRVSVPGSALRATSHGPVVSLGAGRYSFDVTGQQVGTDRFSVVVTTAAGPITIMPAPTAAVYSGISRTIIR